MSDVTVSHLAILPLMVLMIIVFPSLANIVMSNYTNLQRNEMAEGTVEHLATEIQQLYYNLNKDEIMPCTVTFKNPLPATINSYPYKVTAFISAPGDPGLTLTLSLQGLNIMVNKTIVLGQNILWKQSELQSLSPNAAIIVQKFMNGTLQFSFGG